MSTDFTITQTRAIDLLGEGHSQVAVARALGISESRVSQLLSDERFADAVAAKRFEKLERYNSIDAKYDELEELAQEKLGKAIPLMSITSPEKLAKVLQILNNAKRRGHEGSPEQQVTHHHVVTLTLPTTVRTRFTASPVTNEVIEIDGTPLVTVKPAELEKINESRKEAAALPAPAGEPRPVSIPTVRTGQTISASDLE